MEIRHYLTLIQDPNGYAVPDEDTHPMKEATLPPHLELSIPLRAIEEYLDDAIIKLREEKEKKPDDIIPKCYIDAYQSVRVSLLGGLLP